MTRVPLKESSNLELTPSKSFSSSNSTSTSFSSYEHYNYGLDENNHHTPPNSIFNKSINQFETPIKSINLNPNVILDQKLFNFKNDEVSSKLITTSSYLSPAFSSPQTSTSLYDTSSTTGSKNLQSLTSSSPIQKKTTPSTFNVSSEDKPPYSYATLIGISILCHPDKRLTLSHIYQWISDTFKFYKKEDVGWQNSIRHNLSLNKAFIKGEKSKDGKGHFWCIKPGCEEQFLKSRSVKRSSYHEVMDQINQAAKLNAEKAAAAKLCSSPISQSSFELNKKRKWDELEELDGDSNTKDNVDHDGLDIEEEADLTIIDYAPSSKRRNTSNLTTTPVISSTPQFIIDSPDKPMLAAKNLTYTSSYNSNFELSPIRTGETGPLLEPKTPNQHQQCQQQQQPPLSQHHLIHQVLIKRTPKKTPIKNIRTPQTNSILKKIWNSPSYLDDFYLSPNPILQTSHSKLSKVTGNLISYDDDEMIMRNLEIHSSPIVEHKSMFKHWDKQ